MLPSTLLVGLNCVKIVTPDPGSPDLVCCERLADWEGLTEDSIILMADSPGPLGLDSSGLPNALAPICGRKRRPLPTAGDSVEEDERGESGARGLQPLEIGEAGTCPSSQNAAGLTGLTCRRPAD